MASDKYEQVRTQLANRIFTPYGRTVTLQSMSAPTTNSRGEPITANYTEVEVSIVDYNITNQSKTREQFGNFMAGDRYVALPYDTVISAGDSTTPGDVLVLEDGSYRVVEVRKPRLSGEVVILVQCRNIDSNDF